ncbi:MAG: sulfatase [Alphaproteobacteria bacterium]|nr:sulfatase [Alphaproteobacteria bacterium]
MMGPSAILALMSCQWSSPRLPPAPEGQPTSRLHEIGSGGPIRLLDRLDAATLTLPESNRDPSAADLGVIDLSKGWTREAIDEDSEGWTRASPVQLSRRKSRTPPAGLSLFRGDHEVTYRCPPLGLSDKWCVDDGALWVSSTDDPNTWDPPPVMVSSRSLRLVERLDRASAGLDPVDYVRYELTLYTDDDGQRTRPGMLLPAPGEASWTLTLPPDAALDMALSLVPLGLLDGPASDGVTLEVLVNGAQAGRARVKARDGFQLEQVDLSAWGGQEVTLTLRSAPGATAWWDYLFIGTPQIRTPPKDTVRRVIVIGLDTTRYASLTQHGYARDTTAALQDFAASSVIFDRAWAPAPRTRPSFRTATTGRRPFAAVDAATFGEVFREAGFVTAGVTANVHLTPRMGFNDGFDLWVFENAVDAEVEIDRAKGWLEQHQDQDAFLFVHFMDPHDFYTAPWPYENHYVKTDPGPLDWRMNRWQITALADQLTPDNIAWLQARYDSELYYMAKQLAGFVAWADSLPGETLFVMHSDHGEEFFEHGGYEHNHTLYEEVVHAVLWMRLPGGWGGGPHRVDTPVALMDIAPTLYDFIGLPPERWPEVDGTSLRPLLDAGRSDEADALRQTLAARPLPIGHLMYDSERWAVVAEDHKYILQTMSGEEELYDLAADPGEQQNLIEETDRERLDHFLGRLSDATGWPTGPGWRVELLNGKDPFTLRVDGRIVAAEVIDPEAGRKRRANLEWGEIPRTDIEEVGAVEITEDGAALIVTPGSKGRGTLGVILDGWQRTGALVVDGTTLPIGAEGGAVSIDRTRIRVEPGAVILPQDSMRNHVEAPDEDGADDEALEALRALGYIE